MIISQRNPIRQRLQLWVSVLLIAMGSSLAGQDFESILERYTGENTRGYLTPLVTGFGANLNSGLFYTAKIPEDGFHLNFRLNGMAAMFSDKQRVFTAETEGDFIPAQSIETATVIGNGIGATVPGEGGSEYVFPGGLDINSLGLVVPTITLGFAATEVSVRYLKISADTDISGISLAGAGIRHNIGRFIPGRPLDIAVGAAWQQFEITDLDVNGVNAGDIIDNKNWVIHAEAGKSFSIIDLYGGLLYEESNANARYTVSSAGIEEDIDISIKGENHFRVFAGLAINLYVLHLNIDYHLGNQNLLNAGVSLGL